MKKSTIITLILLFNFILVKSQVTYLTRIKIVKDDSTALISNLDTTYIFNAYILTHALNGVSSLSLTCRTYNPLSTTWTINKDTSYAWANISASQNFNQNYNICKPNDNLLMVCLGRLLKGTRQKYTFYITGSNGILTKEFDF